MTLRLFASAARGTAELLADELRALAANSVKVRAAGCEFEGDLDLAYRVCLWSRVAQRVLLEIARFPADDAESLYSGALTVEWERHLDAETTFVVDLRATGGAPEVHGVYGAQRVKDAIVDRLRERTGKRPNVSREHPDLRIGALLVPARPGSVGGEAVLSVDLSGVSLHQRGYRQTAGPAPLRETLAAALLMRCGWPAIAAAGGPFVDPMCGAGTLVIEAALMAAGIAPGLTRERYGTHGWLQHDDTAWRAVRADAERRSRQRPHDLPPITGFDHDPHAVANGRANATRAGVGDLVRFETRDIDTATPPADSPPGLLLCNPPYGERLAGDPQLAALYARIGVVLASRFGGWRAALLAGDPALGRHVGLRAVRRHTFWNGPIECRLLRFEPPASGAIDAAGAVPHDTPGRSAGNTASSDGSVVQPAAGAAAGGAERSRIDTSGLANRLAKNQRRLRKWLTREDIRCYRLYDADIPEFAIAVDVYESDQRLLHVQEYAAPADIEETLARRRLQAALATLREVLEVGREQVAVKRRERQRGAAQYARQAARGRFHEVGEGPARLLVNLDDYLDTGLFLDHRPTRALLGRLAAGRRFLNLFCYTAAATVHAALGDGEHPGASASVSVDLSHTYTEWAQRNLQLNRLDPRRHRLVRAECREWLNEAGYRGERFGVLFVDPPTFSNSKRMRGTFDVQRDHLELLRACMTVLEPGGDLVFSCNRRDFRLDAESLADLEVADISRATLPPDFERNPRIHRCWHIRRRD